MYVTLEYVSRSSGENNLRHVEEAPNDFLELCRSGAFSAMFDSPD